ncbi:MAG: class II histone deacetylase [Solirubrobacterales bacterium]|nr:class II histone deacetylase [Solirubrobacterales bacterium]
MATAEPKTGLVYDPRCLAHDNGSMVVDEKAGGWIDVAHAENGDRIRRSFEVLDASGVTTQLVPIESRIAIGQELDLVHTDPHTARIKEACGKGQLQRVGPEARANSRTWEPAMIAAGSALACVDYSVGNGAPSYSLTRPPGHHASADQAMGFCLFNNAGLAARHAQRSHGLRRVAILDWDVHHGNGTQDIFYEDPEVLFISIHQDRLYPVDMGSAEERGAGDGVGATVNIPMPAGSGDAGYIAAINEVALPALEAFGPDLLIISSGQDAAASDPLGRMSVTTEGFREMTRLVSDLASRLCHGRIVAVQEGGYSLDHMPFCVLATIEALAGLEPSLDRDPIEVDVPLKIQPAEIKAIRNARKQ